MYVCEVNWYRNTFSSYSGHQFISFEILSAPKGLTTFRADSFLTFVAHHFSASSDPFIKQKLPLHPLLPRLRKEIFKAPKTGDTDTVRWYDVKTLRCK